MRKWNVVPVTSPIEIQYSIAIGTARAQRKGTGAKGITIVQGGDAGTAEGDFATSLIWSSRRGQELPLLMIVTNNRYGISTPYAGQHGYDQISERGKAFNMPTAVIDGARKIGTRQPWGEQPFTRLVIVGAAWALRLTGTAPSAIA